MFRELFTAAPDAIILVDRNGLIVRANPQAERMFGYSELELHEQPVEMLMPEATRQAHMAHRKHYASSPHVRPMGTGQELIGLRRNGETFPVEIALSPISTPEGRMFLASVRDISETQRARQAIARARYDSVIAHIGRELLKATNIDVALRPIPELVAFVLNAPAAAVVIEPLLAQRQPSCAVHGVSADAVLQIPWKPILNAVCGATDGDAQAVDGTVLLEQNTLASAHRLLGPTLLAPLLQHEEPMGALLVFAGQEQEFDHDARHFVQSVANFLSAGVSRIATEERLSHAQRLEAVGQLTGGVAHDFNNLLTIISGNLQIAQDESRENVAVRDALGNALHAVSRGAELTKKLLVFARQQRLSPAPFEADKLLRDVGMILRRTLGESIQLEIACTDGLPPVYADAGQLDSALVNLALNARDAMPRGGNLRICAERADGEDATVAFVVSDTGIGMPPEVLDRALEPFFTTKEPGKGNGLGLSMVYGFVKQSNGQIEIKSKLGYGTRVELRLPAASIPVAEEVQASEGPYRGSGTVLVVEDDAAVRDIAERFLRSFGHDVRSTDTAEAALEILRNEQDIVLVFSDVVLGTGMNGVELAQEIAHAFPLVPVLLTSGYEHAADGDGELDALALLRKPYRREDLADALRRTLSPVQPADSTVYELPRAAGFDSLRS